MKSVVGHWDATSERHEAPRVWRQLSRMTSSHRSIPTTSAVTDITMPSTGRHPRRRHPTTLLWSEQGWRPFLFDTVADLARTGANLLLGVTWTSARLWWRLHDPLTREGQRILVTAAARALETCQRCGATRVWREPTTRMPTSIIGTADGPVRLRRCSTCRLHARNAARFLAELEAADAVGAAREGL